MEKKEFITQLKAELIKRGYAEKTVDEEMIPVGAYFDTNGMSDITVSVTEMADEISEMLAEKVVTEASEAAADSDDDIASALRATVEEEENTQAPASEDDSDGDMKIAPAKEDVPDNTDGQEEYSVGEEEQDIDKYRPAEERDDMKAAGFIGKFIVRIKKLFKKPARAEKTENAPAPESGSEASDDLKYRIISWVLFIIALPFIIALSLLMVIIYIAFWVILAVIMIGFIAGLIAFVFAGALVSLIGIIYGVIMLIKGMTPVGLFEIGLGITVGAATMFFGILIYNFAIRLIPFAMKMLARLLGYAFKRGKEGLAAIKRILQEA